MGFQKRNISYIFFFILSCCFLSAKPSFAFDVPEEVSFAGIKLHLNDGARRQIQSHISFLTRDQKQLIANKKKIQLYLSLVSKILVQEQVPEDYKYLALQDPKNIFNDSEQISEGFWKIDPELAAKMGIKINEQVDERFNPIISTTGVAKYLRRNNLYFKNWLYNMLTLDLGFDQAKEYILESYPKQDIVGVRNLTIDERAHPYIRKFIAYKLVFENYIQADVQLRLKLVAYTRGNNKTLPRLSKELRVNLDDLVTYNRWLKIKRIPGDKMYPVVVPIYHNPPVYQSPLNDQTASDSLTITATQESIYYDFENISFAQIEDLHGNRDFPDTRSEFPNVSAKSEEKMAPTLSSSAGVHTHIVLSGQTLYSIAKKYKTSVTELRKLNALRASDQIFIGQQLAIRPSQSPEIRTSPKESPRADKLHIVQVGETLYSIAKRYEVPVTSIRQWNDLAPQQFLQIGQKLIIEKGNTANLSPQLANPNQKGTQSSGNFHDRFHRQKNWKNLSTPAKKEDKATNPTRSKIKGPIYTSPQFKK